MGKPRTATDILAADEARSLRANGARTAEKRSFRDPTKEMERAFMVVSSSGAAVSEGSAVTIPTVAACVGLLADMVAKLPCKLYRTTQEGAAVATDHPAHRLIHAEPGQLSTPYELRRDTMTGVGFGGNGYIRLWRDSYYQPGELQWLRPVDVLPELVKRPDGRKFPIYHVDGVRTPLTRADLVHVKGLSTDGLMGLSPVRAMRESMGLALTQRQQAGKLFANGARFPGFLSSPPTLKPEQLEQSKKEWQAAQAGADNAGKTPILLGGWTYTATNGMSMQDAEFLESRKFERAEIATWYRVPEIMLGNSEKTSSWGTGVEQITLGFLQTSLDPWLVNWEQSLDFTMLTADERAAGYFFRFNRRALLAVALEQQAKFLRDMRDIRVYSVNDCRRFLDENTLADGQGGDDYAAPFNGSGGTPTAKPSPKKEDEPAEPVTA